MTALNAFPVPANEEQRLRVVDTLGLGDAAKDPFFDTLAEAARDIFGLPSGLVTIITENETVFPAHPGLDLERAPRSSSLCAFAATQRAPLLLHDTHLDPRTVNHPAVTGAISVRSYFSMPIVLSSGFCVGSVCALGPDPSEIPTELQVSQLRRLADLAVRFLERPLDIDGTRAATLSAAASEAQDEFLSLVGHELRTPLNGICGMAQLLSPNEDDEIEIIQAIVASAGLLEDLVENILSFTELRSGDIQLDENRVDLIQKIHEAESQFRPIAAANGKSSDLSALSESLWMTGDEPRLMLALSCLMSNFIAHGGTSGRVSVRHIDDGSVELIFADDGDGISPDRRKVVLEAFGVGSPVHQRMADGLGLGLPLTRRIVELHGGRFVLEQGADGLAARIQLPAWRFAQAPDAA